MYYVGIDIAKYKHDCCIIDQNHKIIKDSFTFANNQSGFNDLLSTLSSLGSKSNIKIGFESTGHYGTNLKVFLSQHNFNFMEFNALLLHKFIETQSLRKLKTDKSDCKYIANYLTTIVFKPYNKEFYHIYSLKSLVRNYDSIVRDRSQYIMNLTNTMDVVFPEFKPFFNDIFGETALYILYKYPSLEKISSIPDDDYQTIHNISRGKFSSAKLCKLRNLAKNSIGSSNEYTSIQLKAIISILKSLDTQANSLKKQITSIIQKINPHILTIPGIGPVTTAIIYSEIGDFNSFSSADKIVAFAGLEPAFYQSGISAQTGHMVKHGSPLLRYALMNATIPMLRFNPVFSNYYYKKRSEGKCHRVALSHLAKKLVRVMYTLETKSLDYDSKMIK